MKVKDLVRQLKKLNQESEVKLDTSEGEFPLILDSVHEEDDKVFLYGSEFNMDNFKETIDF